MIKSIEANKSFLDVLQRLSKSEHVFYLTGSQFFHGKGNDTDFFVASSPQVVSFLEMLGFVRAFEYPPDPYTWRVLVNEDLKIHVQLIYPESIGKKKIAQNSIHFSSMALHDKLLMRKVWMMAFLAQNENMEDKDYSELS